MVESISKLMSERKTMFLKNTSDIIATFSGRLSQAFQRVLDNHDGNIHWATIEPVYGSTKSVFVSGSISLTIGEVIEVDGTPILLDEKNINEYAKSVKFAYPIIILELGTVDDIERYTRHMMKLGDSLEVSPDEFVKVVDRMADKFQEDLLDDPMRLNVVTKPDTVAGFSTNDLSDFQILSLKIFEDDTPRVIN